MGIIVSKYTRGVYLHKVTVMESIIASVGIIISDYKF